jgi:hypothetical protein
MYETDASAQNPILQADAPSLTTKILHDNIKTTQYFLPLLGIHPLMEYMGIRRPKY